MISDISIEKVQKLLSQTRFAPAEIEIVNEGVSTDVFKLVLPDQVLYLRILRKGDAVGPQVAVHKLLCEKGVLVPQVLMYKENCGDIDGRSFMLVTEIAGESVKKTLSELTDLQAQRVIFEAGRNLALINSISVKNFGDIEAFDDENVIARQIHYKEGTLDFALLALDYLVEKNELPESVFNHLRSYLLSKRLYFEKQRAVLNHGDFDLSHIYQKDGVFTGIIDFGDLRGASTYQDLAHYKIHSPEKIETLLEGYLAVALLPSNYLEFIEIESTICALSGWQYGVQTRNFELIQKAKAYFKL